MKRLLLSLLLSSPVLSFCQDSTITFGRVVELPGTTKDDLYQRAQDWFLKAFNSKEVIQYQDKEAGQITGKGKADLILYNEKQKPYASWMADFKVTFWLKDGKYRYEFTDISAWYPYGDQKLGTLTASAVPLERNAATMAKKRAPQIWADAKRGADTVFGSLSTYLEKIMATKPKSEF